MTTPPSDPMDGEKALREAHEAVNDLQDISVEHGESQRPMADVRDASMRARIAINRAVWAAWITCREEASKRAGRGAPVITMPEPDWLPKEKS